MKKIYLVVLGILCALLLAGTFLDLQIDTLLFNPESAFGEFFAVAVMVPIWILVPMTTGLLFGAMLTLFRSMNIGWKLISLGLLCFGIYATYDSTSRDFGSRHLHGLPFEILVFMVIAAFLLATTLGFVAAKKYPTAVFQAAIVGVVAVCGGRLLLGVFKEMWGRQRFWTMDNPDTQFTAWYLPQFPNAERRAEMGDFIKSFPSGHSMGAISVLWLSMLPSFLGFCQRNLKKWTNGAAIFALAFWIAGASSRLVLGEHFLSDVTISAMIFLIIFITMSIITDKITPKFNNAFTR